jgi:hypothetical protein
MSPGIWKSSEFNKSIFDANTIVKADVDDTPIKLDVPEQTLVGRITSGNIDALTVAEVLTLLGLSDALIYKGVIDCAANPNYPAADAGDYYKVSVAGKIGGASGLVVELGDALICTTDSTASGDQATVGNFWNILQTNIDLSNSGPINMQDALLTRPEIKDYSETKTAPSSASNVLTLDIENGNIFSTLLTENVTTLNFNNPSPTGKACSFTWVMTQHSAAVTVTWPVTVKWDSGTAPTITANNGIYVFTFVTYDEGTTWLGFLAGSKMAVPV